MYISCIYIYTPHILSASSNSHKRSLCTSTCAANLPHYHYYTIATIYSILLQQYFTILFATRCVEPCFYSHCYCCMLLFARAYKGARMLACACGWPKICGSYGGGGFIWYEIFICMLVEGWRDDRSTYTLTHTHLYKERSKYCITNIYT